MARADVRRETAAGRSPEDRLAVWAPPLYRWLLHDLGGDRCLLLSEFRMTGSGRVRSGCRRRPVEGRRGKEGQTP